MTKWGGRADTALTRPAAKRPYPSESSNFKEHCIGVMHTADKKTLSPLDLIASVKNQYRLMLYQSYNVSIVNLFMMQLALSYRSEEAW